MLPKSQTLNEVWYDEFMTSEEQEPSVRPWGRYDILDVGPGYKVKRITVMPGQRLSYQRHARRSEVWTIVSGDAIVMLDDIAIKKAIGECITIPIGAKHRVQNLGDAPTVFIEVQIGEYLEEDDIERFEDDYGRAT